MLVEAEAWLPWAAMHYVLLLAAGHGQHAARDYTYLRLSGCGWNWGTLADGICGGIAESVPIRRLTLSGW